MATELGRILLDIVIILVAGKVAGELFERMRQPAVLGELLVGIVIGPSLFGFIDLSALDLAAAGAGIGAGAVEAFTTAEIINFIAGLGVLLLLFEVGLESNIKELAKVGKSASYVAFLGIFVSFALGFAASWVFGRYLPAWPDNTILHLFVGATFTATSVGITARVLSDLGQLSTAEARVILGAAVLDDVGGLIILAVVAALAVGDFDLMSILSLTGIALAFLVVAVFVGIKLMPRVMDFMGRLRVRGAVLAAAVVFAVGLSYLAELVHLAGIIGAFAAGLVLAQTRQHHDIFERVRPLGDVFIPFFFVVMGVKVDLRAIGDDWVPVLAVAGVFTVVAILGKLACGWGVTEPHVRKLVVGVGMVPRGEVGLIFALTALDLGIIGQWEYASILVVVLVTTFIAPLWLKTLYRGKVAPPPERPEPRVH